MVVYAPGDGEFTAVAREIAADRDDELIDDLDGLDDEDVIYVDGAGSISERALQSLQGRLLEKGPDSGGFGIITGFTPEHARDLYYRDADEDGTDALLSLKPFGHPITDEDTETVDGDDLTIQALADLQEGGLRSLNLLTRGWNMHLKVAPGEGLLCGYPRSLGPEAFEGRQPYCVRDGEMDCPFDEPIVHAEDVDASHAFVSSCASMIDNDLSGLPVHVGVGLLSSVASLVGSYQVSPTALQELLLHHSAFRAGYPAIERCYLLNENAHALQLKAYPYVTFGKPGHAIESARSEYDVDVHREGEDLVVEVTDVDTYLIDVTIPHGTVDSDAGSYYLRDVMEPPNDRLRYTVFPEDDGVRLLVFTGDRIEADRLRFHLDDRPADHETRQLLASYLHNAETAQAMDVLGTKGKRQLRNLRNNLHSFAGEMGHERYDPNVYRELIERTDEFIHHARQIRDPILESYHSRPNVNPMHTYAGRLKGSGTSMSGIDCPRCGRPLYFIEGATFDDEVRRVAALCPMDGCVFDVPRADDRELHYPLITTDLVETDEDRPTMTVEFENPYDHPAEVLIVPFLPVHPGGRDAQTAVFDTLEVEVTLQAGEATSVDVGIDTRPLPPGQYIINAYLLVNLELYSAGTMMAVGGKGGFVVGEHR